MTGSPTRTGSRFRFCRARERSGRAKTALAWLAAGCAILSGCGERAQGTHDLLQLLGEAEVHRETVLVDFGAPEAAAFLGDGWSYPEASAEETFSWAVGDRSAVRIFVAEPGERVLVARCLPFLFEEAPTQALGVSINGRELATSQLERGLAVYRWKIPADWLRPGDNDVGFSYAYHRSPADVIPDSQDRRSLAVAWYELRVEGSRPGDPPAVEARGSESVLRVSFGSRIDYFLRIARPAELSLGGLRPVRLPRTGSDPIALRVVVEGDETGPLLERNVPPGDGIRLSIPLRNEEEIVRLSLLAISPSPADDPAAGMELGEAAVRFAERAATPAAQPASAGPGGPRPHIILYTVDCLRADHLGVYRYPLPTSPRIDGFARDAVVFDDARATTSWTRPAVASLLTGRYPGKLGVLAPADVLPARETTLPELLRSAGYTTAAIVTNGNLAPEFGLAQGFDSYLHLKEDLSRPSVHQDASRLHEEAVRWIESRDASRPFFLYLHATDPHAPYVPDPEFRQRFAGRLEDPTLGSLGSLAEFGRLRVVPSEQERLDLVALYDAEIAFVDREFGRLLDFLKERGLYAEALVGFVADHGEEFREHGWWEHGKTLYDEQLRVPLLLKYPGSWASGTRVAAPASQVDLLPTLLSHLALPVPPASDGVDLTPFVREGFDASERPIHAELDREGRSLDSVKLGRWKLIDYRAYMHPLGKNPHRELYDLAADPHEQRDLARERPVLAGYLRALISRERATSLAQRETARDIDEETREALSALGYME
jgi:arylsulfatase A-like enzyme